MITWLNRKELFVDYDAEAAAKVWSVLKENHIEYEMRTKQNVSTLEKNIHYTMGKWYAGGGMGAGPFSDSPQYVYTIYVKKKDFDKAIKLCNLSNK